MGDLADDFRKIPKKQGWECPDCDGSGYDNSTDDELIDCKTCGGDGIKVGHPLKEHSL
jgi:DnaJ-class molecular chaperone